MIFAEGYPKYMPTPYSIYVSNFTERVLEELKKAAPFARYHKDTKEYEITDEVFEHLKKFEAATRKSGTGSYKPDILKFTLSEPEPFSYQQDAVDYAKENLEILLNFSQGMGKTLTTLRILEEYDSPRNLIITGVANLQEEWLKDAHKHKPRSAVDYAELLNMCIVGNSPDSSVASRLKWLQSKKEERFTHLIGIESLRNVPLVETLNSLNYTSIIIDECQSAKGMKADQTQGLHDLRYFEGQRRIALSGTPILNDPLEYYSVLRFLKIFYYHSSKDQCARTTFEKYYGIWGYDYLGNYVCEDYKNLDKLKLLLQPILCYAPKKLLGLPPKRREVVSLREPIELKDKLRLHNKKLKEVKKAGYSTKQALWAEIQLMLSSYESKTDFILSTPKRSLVFSKLTRALEIVKDRLEKAGKKVLFYHGKLSMPERLLILEKWKSSEEYDVLLLSINAARYGLNLQEVSTTIFLEPPTSFAVLEQAEDRAHRIGQTKEVYSYILMSGKPDEDKWATMLKKQESLKKVLGD